MHFKKSFDTIPKGKILTSMLDLKIHFELRFVIHKLYKKVITKLKTNQW